MLWIHPTFLSLCVFHHMLDIVRETFVESLFVLRLFYVYVLLSGVRENSWPRIVLVFASCLYAAHS